MPHQDIIHDGERWPSVTEIIGELEKPGLKIWEKLVGKRKAAEIRYSTSTYGKEIHEEVANYLTSDLPIHSDAGMAWLNGFWNPSGFELEDCELKVKSLKHKYGGTLDATIKKAGKLYIADWKFSNSDDPIRALQLAGYAIAYEEQTRKKLNGGLIVRVSRKKDRNGIYKYTCHEPLQYNKLNPWKAMFLALLKEIR